MRKTRRISGRSHYRYCGSRPLHVRHPAAAAGLLDSRWMPIRPGAARYTPSSPAIDLNVARVRVGAVSFDGWRRAYEENVRHEVPRGWDSLRSDEWIYGWRITGQEAPPEGWETYSITSDETPRVFWRSIERGLARSLVESGFSGPFGKGRVLVEGTVDLLSTARSGLLSNIHLHPAFTLELMPHSNLGPNERIVLIGVRTSWRMHVSIADLHAANVDCAGFGVRLEGGAGTPWEDMDGRIVGSVTDLDSGEAILVDPRNPSVTRLPAQILFPEANHPNLRRVVETLAPGSWQEWSEQEEAKAHPRAQLERFRRLVGTMGANPIEAVPRVTVTVSREPAVSQFFPAMPTSPPELVFDYAAKQRDVYATRGLKRFGPYDSAGINRPRFLVIGPKSCQPVAHDFFGQLLRGCESPDPTKGYLAYAGFSKLFRSGSIDWDYEFFDGPTTGANYRRVLLEKLEAAKRPDLILVVLHEADKELPEAEDPYCVVKAAALGLGFPVSALTVEDMANRHQRAFILHNVALQGFAKMGGTPYVLGSTAAETAELIIGVGRSDVVTSRFSRRRFLGYASVFKANGDYILATVRPFEHPDRYEAELEMMVANSLREAIAIEGIQDGGKIRLTFHLAKRPGQRLDIAPVQAALKTFKEYEIETAFVHVSDNHAWLVVARNGATGVPERGTMVRIGTRSRLLCVIGASQYLGRGTPTPLRIDLDGRSSYGEIDTVARQVFGFTAVTWRGSNVSAKPVTIQYAELACELAGRLEGLEGWNSTALDVLLRGKRWFL